MSPLPPRFLALDVETTGFSPTEDRVLELGLVEFVGGALAGAEEHRLDPQRPIPAVVSQITGLYADDVVGRPRFGSVARGLVERITRTSCVVAYNAPFDRRFLAAELARAGTALPDVPWVDVLALARDLEPPPRAEGTSFSLSHTCARHGVQLLHAHRAQADARATGELFLAFALRAGRRTWSKHVPARALKAPEPPLSQRMAARVLSLFS